MTDFERELRSLSVAWPPAPDVRIVLARRRRRGFVVAVALAVVVVSALAVPQSRSAILHFFHLGRVTVVQVDTLPPAAERPLAVGLGQPVSSDDAARMLGAPFLPAGHSTLYGEDGLVSTLLAGPVLLSEFGSPFLIKKVALANGKVEYVEVAPGVTGLWIAGAPHVVFFPDASPRLAGNVLVWANGNVTFRLEGRGLAKETALRLAREILGTGSS